MRDICAHIAYRLGWAASQASPLFDAERVSLFPPVEDFNRCIEGEAGVARVCEVAAEHIPMIVVVHRNNDRETFTHDGARDQLHITSWIIAVEDFGEVIVLANHVDRIMT